MDTYDLVIIGSGAGLNLMNSGLQSGMEVALVEETKIGGTCLTRGCIPSKILVHPADLIREAEHAKKVGLHFKLEKIDWNSIAKRMWEQIDESKQMEKGISSIPSVKLYKGIGEFTGEYEMEVKSTRENKSLGKFRGDRFVLTSGSRPLIPPIEGLEEVSYVTNRSFFGDKFPDQPWKSLIIIGGGVIAAEFAHIFSAMGTEVTIVEMLPRLVTTEEPEISSFLEQNLKKFMTIYVNNKAIKAYRKKQLKVSLLPGGNQILIY